MLLKPLCYADMRLTIRAIEQVFGFDGVALPRCDWDMYQDIERQLAESMEPANGRVRSNSYMSVNQDVQREEELRAVAERLASEFENAPQDDDSTLEVERSPDSIAPRQGIHSFQLSGTATPNMTTAVNTPPSRAARHLEGEELEKVLRERGPHALAHDFAVFDSVQHELITRALTSGALTDCTAPTKLRVHSPQPSVFEMYGRDYIRGKRPGVESIAQSLAPTPAQSIRRRSVRIAAPEDEDNDSVADIDDDSSESKEKLSPARTAELAGDHSLIRVYSMLFALG